VAYTPTQLDRAVVAEDQIRTVISTFKVVVPSVMHLIGKANWYFPKSLERIIPHVAIDADDAAEARVTVPVPRGDEDELARV
jgi:hypothetical protein